jgi:2-dehydro-3-deoxygluconokinase
LGHQTGWISKVGLDEFGKSMVSFVRGEGVEVSQVGSDPEAPTGVYFKEVRSGDRVQVQYYRQGSAASRLTPSDLNETYISKAKYLHITGITPALSESCYETVIEAISIAKAHGLTVIFDPNLRRKIWSEEKARKVLLEISSFADIILPGIDEGQFMFNEDDPKKLGQLFLNHGASLVVLKVGAAGAYYFTEESSGLVEGFRLSNIVDPVGAGDGFAAGLISGLLDQLAIQEAVKRANAVGAMVTLVEGDVEGLPDRDELHAFMNPSTKGDVQR